MGGLPIYGPVTGMCPQAFPHTSNGNFKWRCLRVMCMMQHQHIDHRDSSAAPEGSFLGTEIPFHSHINSHPYIMSTEIGTSILDAALAYIGKRVSSILLKPANNDKNYIGSLHKEVVSITQCARNLFSLEIGLSLLLCGLLAFCHLAAAPLKCRSQLGLPFVGFQTLGTQAPIQLLKQTGSWKEWSRQLAFSNLILQSGGNLKGRQ